MAAKFAAVQPYDVLGTTGLLWGMGDSYEEARADARRAVGRAGIEQDPPSLYVFQLDATQAERLQQGATWPAVPMGHSVGARVNRRGQPYPGEVR